MKRNLYLIIVIFILSACSGQKIMKTASSSEIIFGSSGGFTNVRTEFIISEGKEVKKREQTMETLLHQIDKKTARELFKQIETIQFKNLKINEPGNITYFITIKTPEFENTTRWNDNSDSDQLKNLYKNLVSTLQTKPTSN